MPMFIPASTTYYRRWPHSVRDKLSKSSCIHRMYCAPPPRGGLFVLRALMLLCAGPLRVRRRAPPNLIPSPISSSRALGFAIRIAKTRTRQTWRTRATIHWHARPVLRVGSRTDRRLPVTRILSSAATPFVLSSSHPLQNDHTRRRGSSLPFHSRSPHATLEYHVENWKLLV